MANGTEAVSEKFLGLGGGSVLDLGIRGTVIGYGPRYFVVGPRSVLCGPH